MDIVYISQECKDRLEQELNTLRSSLHKANEEGTRMGGPMDSFKEAAAFQVSQGAKNTKIKELEEILKNIKILPLKIDGDSIILGKWFSIDNGMKITRYRLVHPVEADPSNNLLSIESPLGKNVLKMKEGHSFVMNESKFKLVTVE